MALLLLTVVANPRHTIRQLPLDDNGTRPRIKGVVPKDTPLQYMFARYGRLWRKEEGFRVLKHTIAVRPVFHWTERRSRAHIAICFVAFAMLRILRQLYKKRHRSEAPISEGRILAQLREVECVPGKR